MSIAKTELDEFLEFSLALSYEAGEILLRYQKKRASLLIRDKGADGLASEADIKSEELILKTIKETYPNHFLLSEEDWSKQKEKSYQKAQSADFAWLIDPLDGTNNFINGIPIYAVSIGLISKGEPIVGVVYNPTSGECFFGHKDGGAYLLDFKINPFKRNQLPLIENNKNPRDCLFSPAPDYEKLDPFERQLSAFRKNIVGARAVRRLGSAALELCYVANGNLDGYWEKNLKPWDVAAAAVICKEAGVKLTDFNGKISSPFDDSILAAGNPLHDKILGKLNIAK